MSEIGQEEKHVSYGQIIVNRVQSSKAEPCYGSALRYSNYINIEIHESTLYRSMSHDRYMSSKGIITVRVTENQWATLISTLNLGGGTPCTIERRDGKLIEDPPFRDQREMMIDDFGRKSRAVVARLDEMRTKLAALTAPGAKISKSALQDIQNDIDTASREVGANMPFMAEQFAETLDKSVTAARSDIEAHVMAMQLKLGLSASTDSYVAPQLGSGIEEN